MRISSEHCRLCSGDLEYQFTKRVLSRYDVSYYQCRRCKSLQTEEPYWLNESYSSALGGEDSYAVSRCQMAQVTVSYIARVFRLRDPVTVLDYGGGNGLLVRMLRDVGLHATLFDEYIENRYAVGFQDDVIGQYDVVTLLEVLEHLSTPAQTLRDVFATEARVIYGTTKLYSGQDSSWGYLVPGSGAHVFFYSREAMDILAEMFGYSVLVKSPHILFYRGHLGTMGRLILEKFLFGRYRRILDSMFPYFSRHSLLNEDRDVLREKGLIRN